MRRFVIGVAVVAALVFAIFLGLRHGEPASDGVASGQAAPAPVESELGSKVTELHPKAGLSGRHQGPPGAGVIVREGKPVDPNDPEGFTDFDVADVSRVLSVELGSYRCFVGDEFTVTVTISGPALESLTVVGSYDGDALECLADTAEGGPLFRNGIEFYVQEEQGRFALIHQGEPGRKNLDATVDGVTLVQFRMRADKAGRYALGLPDGLQSFTHALGAEAQYTVSGGSITVR